MGRGRSINAVADQISAAKRQSGPVPAPYAQGVNCVVSLETRLFIAISPLYARAMSPYQVYRANAEAQRAAAEATPLANRREMHLRSAETWEAMAAAIRDAADRALVNEAAKAALKVDVQ